MQNMVDKLLRQYGMEVRLPSRSVKALFQPVTGKAERLSLLDPGPAGLDPRGCYIYIGPLEPEVQEDMVLTVSGRHYIVRSARQINGTGGPVYSWAMCVERGGNGNGQ